MQPITLKLHMFGLAFGGLPRATSELLIVKFLRVFVDFNCALLRQHPKLPLLYQSDVQYKAEKSEIWQDIKWVIETGYGDCEDLASWRCAELRVKGGINAQPFIRGRKVAKGTIYHALVQWPDGRVEDPSIAMGMRGVMHRKSVFIP
jgi:hypothetical protein